MPFPDQSGQDMSVESAIEFLKHAPPGATLRGYEGEVSGVIIEDAEGRGIAIIHNSHWDEDGCFDVSDRGMEFWKGTPYVEEIEEGGDDDE